MSDTYDETHEALATGEGMRERPEIEREADQHVGVPAGAAQG